MLGLRDVCDIATFFIFVVQVVLIIPVSFGSIQSPPARKFSQRVGGAMLREFPTNLFET